MYKKVSKNERKKGVSRENKGIKIFFLFQALF
jgi:hypothetical protein